MVQKNTVSTTSNTTIKVPTWRSKKNEKGQKSNLICELASRTHDAESAARVARVDAIEQDDAIDDPGDVEDDDRRNGEERSKSQDHFIVKGAGHQIPCDRGVQLKHVMSV